MDDFWSWVFEVLQPDGNIAYSRNGQFTTDGDGRVVTSGAGYVVQPEMNVPDDAQSITVSQDGEVSVRVKVRPKTWLLVRSRLVILLIRLALSL